MSSSKYMHIAVALGTLASARLIVYFFPELWQGNITRFGTAGFFITAYGVLFAIIEVLRANSATKLVSYETSKILTQVQNLSGLRLLTECQSAIDLAIQVIDSKGTPHLAMLNLISKIYSEHFHEQLLDPSSKHRHHTAMLESFAIASARKVGTNNLGKLRGTFLAMTNELATETARRSRNGGLK